MYEFRENHHPNGGIALGGLLLGAVCLMHVVVQTADLS